MNKLSENCPLREWARPFGGDLLSDDKIIELWHKTLDTRKFQQLVKTEAKEG